MPSSTLPRYILLAIYVGCHFVMECNSQFMYPPDNNTYTRKINDSCVCGADDGDPKFKRWTLYVHAMIGEIDGIPQWRTCLGIIVNSNMVLTSHKCYLKKGAKSNIYDAWHPPNSNFVGKSDIIVSLYALPELGSEGNANFTVKDMVYSERYLWEEYWGTVIPESDVAIIVIEYNIVRDENNYEIGPICVPLYNQLPTDFLLNTEGYYDGLRGWDNYAYNFHVVVYNFTTIKLASDCIAVGNFSLTPRSEDSLCIRFSEPGPTREGGPLRITRKRLTGGGPPRSYLVGMAVWVDKEIQGPGRRFAFFSNINDIVKHIEKHAEAQGSEWCDMPNPHEEVWPWEYANVEIEDSLACSCGTRPGGDATGRIAGGVEATPHEFPWFAKLSLPFNTDNGTEGTGAMSQRQCGGAIINNRVILTAANCAVNDMRIDKNAVDFNVLDYADSPNLTKVYVNSHMSGTDPQEIDVPVQKVIFHPGWVKEAQRGRHDYDIALIILASPLDLSETASPKLGQVCLPKAGFLKSVIGKNATVAGFGALSVTDVSQQATALQKVDLPVYDILDCTSVDFREKGERHPPTGLRVCAGNFTTVKNSAAGDSGGSLVVENENGRLTTIGIVSYANEYFDDGKNVTVNYYTNVEPFLPFINYYSEVYDAQGCKQ